MESPDKEKWLTAFQKEYDAQIRNKTWELALLPPGRVALNCKIIGKIKPAYKGVEEVYKGRLVVIGSRQRYGLDYEEIFSPVPHNESVKAVVSECAARDMEIMQFDRSTAFLYADLDEDVYMKQPEMFVVPGKEHLVCLLKKSVNGLKQAPRLWYGRFDRTLGHMGFKPSRADRCVYVKRTKRMKPALFLCTLMTHGLVVLEKRLVEIRAGIGEKYLFKIVPPTRYIGITTKNG